MGLKRFLIAWRRMICENLGIDRYSRPSLHALDRKLEKYLSQRNGFFIEAGANDGYSQSNTYYFEKIKNWRGILIEPMPQLAEKCRKIRPRSSIYQCALVAEEYPDDRVSMIYAGLMSLVSGARKSSKEDWKHVEEGIRIQPSAAASYEITVPARTLTSILEEVGPPKIDFFSLDVEGFELEVLKGLDLDRFRPEFILVEASYPEEIKPYLAEYEYGLIEQLTHHDLLYRDIQKNDPSGSWPDK